MQPLAGRRIWFAGIGGVGLSGYALLSAAWGAETAGWDTAETPYLAPLREAGIEVSVLPEPPPPPEGWEVVVGTAFRDRLAGRTRAELLAELVSIRDAVVVAGAHGKTTTAAMIAFALDRLDHDPAFVIGGDVPQLGGNARAGKGWLVAEGDESDRTIASLRPRVAVVTNVDLDHHTEFASRADVEELFGGWVAKVPTVIRGDELEPLRGKLAVPGEHNRRNAACALAALIATGADRGSAERALREFRGVGRRLERRGEVGGVAVYDDYAHNPVKVAAALAALRETGASRVLALFQPHLYSRTRHLAYELAGALAAADAVAVTEIYPAREQPAAGVTGRLVVEALAGRRPGMPLAWTPDSADGARFLARRARSGDALATLGAGDVDSVVSLLLEELA
ncbi:MAG: glutamate ligase domain-containing protein [Gaiellaceae bacterium]